MGFMGRVALPATTEVALFSSLGLSNSGTYEVQLVQGVSGGVVMNSVSGAGASGNGVGASTGCTLFTPGKWYWDSSEEIYIYNSNVNPSALNFVISKVPSVGLSVNCS